ncbi:hypothetical protein P154DRAFT_116313 [Amniculicola lignicola CBS 123094]|uniref:NTF2-domain-containing protein n=1 Tax=Amniculicola lignicola CBS 123094 TaxID=1392246 RepID=A0A6A5X314_9PLEO|nr:hypothetical protein P154DRAFT_116313 [Amniculicola lignicola CBS 123094]
MATNESVPVNGNFAPQAYDATSTNFGTTNNNSASAYGAGQQGASAQSAASTSEIPKDEVGWYFVEQYYTTLSKSPERLYLFYNKRSQYVSGTEEDKVQVCMGLKSINDRIKELDFHDTKVRVTNVDSQGSDANIVIQVIGEISNKGQPHRRFVQTFVLAEQTNGYFVLNDIFRYMAEDPEEEEEDLQQDPAAEADAVQEPASVAAVPEDQPAPEAVAATNEDQLNKVNEKLEEAAKEEDVEEAAPADVNGTPIPEATEIAEAEDTPAAAVSATEEASGEDAEKDVEEAIAEPEKPKEPAPTPVPAPSKPTRAATPSAPPKPAAPRTWASLAASAHKVATPQVPAPATPQAPAQAKSTTAAQTPSQPAAAPSTQGSAPAREPSPAGSQTEASGWQTATGHKKEQSRVQIQAPTTDGDNKRAYIKNVYSQVEEPALRSLLIKYGEIEYLDISRQKNCAFVDFKTLSGFQAAVKANPHTVNGIEIRVEERRLRPNTFQGSFPRGGGGAPRGRGNLPPRGGFQQRGGRGGAMGRGGRPAPQEA